MVLINLLVQQFLWVSVHISLSFADMQFFFPCSILAESPCCIDQKLGGRPNAAPSVGMASSAIEAFTAKHAFCKGLRELGSAHPALYKEPGWCSMLSVCLWC